MPRQRIINDSEFPYHITARCHNADWFKLPIETIWEIMEDYLYMLAQGHSARLHSFVLMNNHFHLLATFPEGNISEAMNQFMRETSREITRLSGRINQTYGSRHKKSLIKNYHYFMNAYKYVYQNPLRAGLCKKVETYPFSTLAGLCGHRKMSIPLQEDTLLFSPNFDEKTLLWLNQLPDPIQLASMKQALKRPVLKLSLDRKSKKANSLEHVLL